MEILGLEKDYYLAGNDIYIVVKGTSKESRYLDVEVSNVTSSLTLGSLRPYPNLSNEYRFNICFPVRPLFPEPDSLTEPNSVQKMSIKITATLIDDTTETVTIVKNFVRGGRNKHMADEWNLNDGTELLSAPFPKFIGVPELPAGVHKISGDKVVEFVPKIRHEVFRFGICKPTYLRFLNSLGGYEWWVFEQRIDQDDSKAGKTKTTPTTALKQHNSRQLATLQGRDLTLSTELPMIYYDLAVEIINSTDIYIYYPDAPIDDPLARYERVYLNGTNKLERNTVAKKVKLDLKLTLPTYITRQI